MRTTPTRPAPSTKTCDLRPATCDLDTGACVGGGPGGGEGPDAGPEPGVDDAGTPTAGCGGQGGGGGGGALFVLLVALGAVRRR